MKKNNLVGERFGRLLVTHDAGRTPKKQVRWGCICECGGHAVAAAYDLRAGKVVSCGCLVKSGLRKTHGLRRTRVYSVWAAMVQRCTNPKDRSWGRYGGAGITMHPSWSEFSVFYEDTGKHYAPGLTLDRIENGLGYNPTNCRWVTAAEQARNRSCNVWFTVGGVHLVQTDAAKALRVNRCSLAKWRKEGLTDAQIEDLAARVCKRSKRTA